jgi:hypothetical protein
VLPEPTLEPGNQPVDEVDNAGALLVDDDVLFFVRDVQSKDPFVDRLVEELECGLDQALNAASVEPGES